MLSCILCLSCFNMWCYLSALCYVLSGVRCVCECVFVCIYTQKCFNRIPIWPLRVFPWNLYNNKNKAFSPGKISAEWIQGQEHSHDLHIMNTLTGQIRENQGLNAKRWDRAHASRAGAVARGTRQRERLVWKLRLSPVWGGGFGEAAGNALLLKDTELQVSVPGWSSLGLTPSSDTSPQGTLGKSPRDFKFQGPPLWAGETRSSPTGIWGLRVSSFRWHLLQSALSKCGLYEDHEFFFHGSNTHHTQLRQSGIKRRRHPWTSAAYFIN